MSGKTALRIFSLRDFRLFVFARFFLTLAILMQMSTISLQVYYEYSKDELLLGLLGLAEALPSIGTSFFSGHFADILPKKRIILVAVFVLLAGAVFLFLNAQNGICFLRDLGLGALFLVVAVFGVTRSFLSASTNPFMSQIVPRELYTSSATWNSTAWHLGAILGPVIACFMYGYRGGFHANWCHFTEIILFVLSLFFILQIRHTGAPQGEKKETIFASMRQGVAFVFKTRMVLSAISLDLFAVLFGGAVALIPPFTDKILHLGPEAYGLLRTAPAIGAVAMALVMLVRPPSKKAGLALLWSVAAFGLFTILFALSTNYWLAFFMLLLTGAFDNVSVVVRHSILQLMTPDSMRGRVSAINSIFIGSSNEIGAFESGLAARILTLVPSIIFGGAMTIGVVLGINRLNPDLKKLDLTRI